MGKKCAQFAGQDYKKIKLQCQLNSNALFVDDKFPATNQSLFYDKSPVPSGAKIEWKRPGVCAI